MNRVGSPRGLIEHALKQCVPVLMYDAISCWEGRARALPAQTVVFVPAPPQRPAAFDLPRCTHTATIHTYIKICIRDICILPVRILYICIFCAYSTF